MNLKYGKQVSLDGYVLMANVFENSIPAGYKEITEDEYLLIKRKIIDGTSLLPGYDTYLKDDTKEYVYVKSIYPMGALADIDELSGLVTDLAYQLSLTEIGLSEELSF